MGSDMYWFARHRELTAKANQKGLHGVVFFALSAADNHCKPFMSLLDVPNDASISERNSAVQNNLHVIMY